MYHFEVQFKAEGCWGWGGCIWGSSAYQKNKKGWRQWLHFSKLLEAVSPTLCCLFGVIVCLLVCIVTCKLCPRYKMNEFLHITHSYPTELSSNPPNCSYRTLLQPLQLLLTAVTPHCNCSWQHSLLTAIAPHSIASSWHYNCSSQQLLLTAIAPDSNRSLLTALPLHSTTIAPHSNCSSWQSLLTEELVLLWLFTCSHCC